MNVSNQRLDGAEFRSCSMANAVFDDVNLSGARLTNVNLSGLTIENANIRGLKIFGYDVEAWIKTQLANDRCQLDRLEPPPAHHSAISGSPMIAWTKTPRVRAMYPAMKRPVIRPARLPNSRMMNSVATGMIWLA